MLRDDLMSVKKEIKDLQDKSDLVRILTIEDKRNKRLCYLVALLLILLVIALGYIIYLHTERAFCCYNGWTYYSNYRQCNSRHI